jgi:hypothetical protein
MTHIKNSYFFILLTLTASSHAYQVTIENDTIYTGIRLLEPSQAIAPGAKINFKTNGSAEILISVNGSLIPINITSNATIKLSKYQQKIAELKEFWKEQERQRIAKEEEDRRSARLD